MREGLPWEHLHVGWKFDGERGDVMEEGRLKEVPVAKARFVTFSWGGV